MPQKFFNFHYSTCVGQAATNFYIFHSRLMFFHVWCAHYNDGFPIQCRSSSRGFTKGVLRLISIDLLAVSSSTVTMSTLSWSTRRSNEASIASIELAACLPLWHMIMGGGCTSCLWNVFQPPNFKSTWTLFQAPRCISTTQASTTSIPMPWRNSVLSLQIECLNLFLVIRSKSLIFPPTRRLISSVVQFALSIWKSWSIRWSWIQEGQDGACQQRLVLPMC